MLAGLQTHIEAWVDPAELVAQYGIGVRAARVSAMHIPIEDTIRYCRDLQAAGLRFLITLHHDRADLVPALAEFVDNGLIAAECGNEHDGNKIPPRGDDLWPWTYRESLDRFCEAGEQHNVPIAGPVASNTDWDSLLWCLLVRDGVPWPGRERIKLGWPQWMRRNGYFSIHTYGPYPHERFQIQPDGTRTEFLRTLDVADGLPILVTEFGWANTTPHTEEQQAREVRGEWKAIGEQLKPWAAFLFQAHDGPDPTNGEHRFGIRACDADANLAPLGEWKAVAREFPPSSYS